MIAMDTRPWTLMAMGHCQLFLRVGDIDLSAVREGWLTQISSLTGRNGARDR